MFNKERFHNALALSLGYERIVKDKRITIQVDDSDDPWVILKFEGSPEAIRFKASGEADAAEFKADTESENKIKYIVEAAHQAYIDASSKRFW